MAQVSCIQVIPNMLIDVFPSWHPSKSPPPLVKQTWVLKYGNTHVTPQHGHLRVNSNLWCKISINLGVIMHWHECTHLCVIFHSWYEYLLFSLPSSHSVVCNACLMSIANISLLSIIWLVPSLLLTLYKQMHVSKLWNIIKLLSCLCGKRLR